MRWSKADEEREARSDGELGAIGSWYLPDTSIQTIYERPRVRAYVRSESGSRVKYGGAGTRHYLQRARMRGGEYVIGGRWCCSGLEAAREEIR